MKYTICLFCFILSLAAVGQIPVSLKKPRVLINSSGRNTIEVYDSVDFLKSNYPGYKIDDDTFLELNSKVTAVLVSNNSKYWTNRKEQISINVTPNSEIVFTIDSVSSEFVRLLNDSIADFYIKTNKDIILNGYKENVNQMVKFKISPGQVEKNTRNKIFLTESMANELINARGGNIFLAQNKLEIGVIPAEQSSSKKTEYNASFRYRTRYSFLERAPVFFYTEGLIGTNALDSLNYLSVYPLSYNFIKGTNELVGQLGVDGNQTFSNLRISGNIYFNGIIPNLIDMTFGEDRLRLKPVIQAGLKFYREVKNNRQAEFHENQFSNQVFTNVYYYIPIQKIYSLILDGSVFYDFNSKANPGKKVMLNYSVILGIDIPKTDFKTIFKYSKGENGISYERNDYIMIGFMMDLLK